MLLSLFLFVWPQIKILCPTTRVQSCDLRANKRKLVKQHLRNNCLELFFQPTCLFLGLKSQKSIFLGAGVWNVFDKCQFVGKRQKIKGGAIKRFLFGPKSWLKEVGSVLPYRQNCAISSDETFVSMSPKVRGWMVTYTDYFFGQNFVSTFLFPEANFSCDTL